MSTFAKNGNRVLYIENTGVRTPDTRDFLRVKRRLQNWRKGVKGFRQESENLYIYSPMVLPFPYSRIARWINKNFSFRVLKRWLRFLDFKNPIIWTFLPTGTALDIIGEIDYSCLVYYCIADFDELVKKAAKIRKTETALIKKADVIFAQGKILEEKCKKFNVHVHIFPFGVNLANFNISKHWDSRQDFTDIKNIKKPIIGYIGGIHRHIDQELLAYAAKNNPAWSFVMIGPIQTDVTILEEMKNIAFLGKKDFSLLPGYIREFDAAIIPYAKNPFTHTVYPTKLNEYHALGKPVIATDLPEIILYNTHNEGLVFIAKNKEEFVTRIAQALKEENNNTAEKRIASAHKHGWDTRISEMSGIIEEAIRNKAVNNEANWQKRFSLLYRTARKKLLNLGLAVILVWLAIFYTPLVWFLGEPLKITDAPLNADAIVVFAGGVGESGQAGQGYEERIHYAVELYKSGYAKRLIVSSGFRSTFSEPYIMQALAVSLGVPKDAIILETKAANTYQNILFSVKILNGNNWKKILLVSSPYHMRRASLVFHKIAPEIQALFTPTPFSIFYSQENLVSKGIQKWKKINLRQINGIIHEYMGILYYWWKGYL